MDVEKRGGKLVKFLESWATKEREDKRWRRRAARKVKERADGGWSVEETTVVYQG